MHHLWEHISFFFCFLFKAHIHKTYGYILSTQKREKWAQNILFWEWHDYKCPKHPKLFLQSYLNFVQVMFWKLQMGMYATFHQGFHSFTVCS